MPGTCEFSTTRPTARCVRRRLIVASSAAQYFSPGETAKLLCGLLHEHDLYVLALTPLAPRERPP